MSSEVVVVVVVVRLDLFERLVRKVDFFDNLPSLIDPNNLGLKDWPFTPYKLQRLGHEHANPSSFFGGDINSKRRTLWLIFNLFNLFLIYLWEKFNLSDVWLENSNIPFFEFIIK